MNYSIRAAVSQRTQLFGDKPNSTWTNIEQQLIPSGERRDKGIRQFDQAESHAHFTVGLPDLAARSSRLVVLGRNCLIAAVAFALVGMGANGSSAQTTGPSAGETPPTTAIGPFVGPQAVPKLSAPASELPPAPPPPRIEVNPLQDSGEPPPIIDVPTGIPDPAGQFSESESQLFDQQATGLLGADGFALEELGDPIVNVLGLGGAIPNDTNGDVGPDDFVQMVNAVFIVFDKQGVPRGPAAAINSLWTTADPTDTSECATQNRGDPIVLYDRAADRWLLSQFAKNVSGSNSDPGYICVAISQTADPTGTYYLYQFTVARFPDYYKIGVWPDGYYVSANFNGPNEALAAVMDRANMLNGNPAGIVEFAAPTLVNNFDVLIPSTVVGETPPPAGTPNFFYRQVDADIIGGAFDRLELWEFHVDWTTPANSTFTGPTDIPTAPFDSSTCGYDPSVPCIEQPGTAQLIDAIQVAPMYRFPYRNFGDREVLVGNFTVDATGSNGAGVRWFELERSGGGAWAVVNEGTYAPQPPFAPAYIHRWMGSANIDRFGNIALGYTASSSEDVFPSARYTGRLASDPVGLLPQPEKTIQAGVSSTGQRWGDYYTMSVDPVDDCTFWYTGDATAAGGFRQSSIASFRFADCALDVEIAKSDIPDPVLAGGNLKYTITVTNHGVLNATNLFVTDTLPAGVSFVSDSLPNPECIDTSVPTIVCNLGDLDAGDSTSFDITVHVASNILFGPDGPIEITNTAEVDQDQDDSDGSNNTISEVTLVTESADLMVSKICKPDEPASAGSTAFCDIIVDNAGPSGARNVMLSDVILSDGAFTIGTISTSQGSCNGPPPAGTVDCDLLDIDAGGRVTVTVEVSSNAGVDVNDTATVSSDTPDPVAANNMAEGSVSFFAVADLSVAKSDTPDPVVAGTNLTYTLAIHNFGPSTATNVVVTDQVPAGVQIVSITPFPASANCTAGDPGNPANPTTCNMGSINSAGGASVEIVVHVLPDTIGLLHNDATVSSDATDLVNGNNVDTEDTTVIAEADLEIEKSATFDGAKPSADLVYLLNVVNNGPSDAQNVVVVDTFPSTAKKLVYLSDTGNGACSYNEAGHSLTCTVGPLPLGASWSVEIRMNPKGSLGLITNTADVSSSTTDPDPGNNSASYDVEIKGGVK